jgi:ankyrin repeat protein
MNSTNDVTTPLHMASQFGQCDIVEALLRRGADVNKTNNYGATTHGMVPPRLDIPTPCICLCCKRASRNFEKALHFSNKKLQLSAPSCCIGSTFVAMTSLPRAEMDKENVFSHKIHHHRACGRSNVFTCTALHST